MYLATAVWKEHPNPFKNKEEPAPIRMSSLPKEKITEFRSRIDQFQIQNIPVEDMPAPINLPNTSAPPPTVKGVEEKMYRGVVKHGLRKRGDSAFVGGIIKFEVNGTTALAIFSIKSFMEEGAMLCIPMTEVMFLPVPRGKDHEISYIATMMTREGFDLPPGVNSTMEADGRELIFQLPHRLMMAIHSLGFSVEEIRPKDSRYYTKFPGEYFFFIIAIGLGFRHYKDHAMAWLHSIQLTFSQVLKNMNH